MPDCGFGRCDGYHKMIDFRLEKSSGLGLLHLRLFTRRVGRLAEGVTSNRRGMGGG
jgi:hypothetical protein